MPPSLRIAGLIQATDGCPSPITVLVFSADIDGGCQVERAPSMRDEASAAIALLCALVGGCATPNPSLSPASDESPSPAASSLNPILHISNGTALTMSLVVNG